MEDGERNSQPYYGEYSWLGHGITRNTQGRYILILRAVLINPVTLCPSS